MKTKDKITHTRPCSRVVRDNIWFSPNAQQLTSFFIAKIIAYVSNESFLARLLTLPTAWSVNFQENRPKNSTNIPQH